MFSTILLDVRVKGWRDGRKGLGTEDEPELVVVWLWGVGYDCVGCGYWNPDFGNTGKFIHNPAPGHFSTLKQISLDNSCYFVILPKNEYSLILGVSFAKLHIFDPKKTLYLQRFAGFRIICSFFSGMQKQRITCIFIHPVAYCNFSTFFPDFSTSCKSLPSILHFS